MRIVEKNDIGSAWINSCRKILEHGDWCTDAHGNKTKECINLSIIVNNPSRKGIVKEYGDKEMIRFMKKNFLNKEPIKEWGYSYGQRIFNHNGVNQFENIAKKLINKPMSRSATINLMDPKNDKGHVPCACVLDIKIRDNRVLLNAFFRSQDIGKKFYADAICCYEIMKKISKITKKKTGKLTINVSSAHIYEKDLENVKKLVKEVK